MIEKHKYKIILIIFLIAGIISVFIFINIRKEKIYYLALGDELCKGITPFGTYKDGYNDFLIRYFRNNNQLKVYNPFYCDEGKKISTLINEIKNDKKINLKKEIIGLTSSIAKADIITLSINNLEVMKKVNYESIYELIDKKYEELEELVKLIEKFTTADIYIVSYYVPLNDNERRKKIDDYIYKRFKEIEKYDKVNYVFVNSGIMQKNYYVPNFEYPYPSLEGYNYISNEILDKIKEKY